MPLSKRHIDNHAEPYPIDQAQLTAGLEQVFPEAVFAYLMGSAVGNMVVPPYGDLDIAALLFCRDEETWLRFYSLTCREYEHQMADYEKQLRYRLEATETGTPKVKYNGIIQRKLALSADQIDRANAQ